MSLPFDNSGAEGRKFPPRRPPLDRCGNVRPRQRQLSTLLAFTAAGPDLLGNLNLKRRLNLNTASAPTHMQSSPPAATISANSGLLGRTDTVNRIATTVTIEHPVSTSITDVEPWRRKRFRIITNQSCVLYATRAGGEMLMGTAIRWGIHRRLQSVRNRMVRIERGHKY
ncbi:hypothetical protein C8J57DRAFT_1253781 [Mycena rebaudengoi]|nr:hypothetical protein C8J57DRAFT_1253781 [Mycena rebaudengoi]